MNIKVIHGGEMVKSTPNKDEGDNHNFKFLSNGVFFSKIYKQMPKEV